MKQNFLVPEALQLSELLPQLNNKKLTKPHFIDKCHYLIDNLYLRRFFDSENKNGTDYMPIHSKTLENVLTPRFATVVKKALVRLDVIEENRSKKYQPGHQSKSYRFTERFRNSRFNAVPITDGKLTKKLDQIRNAKRAEDAAKNIGRSLIVESLEKLGFDWAAALDYIAKATYELENSKRSRRRAIEAFRDGELFHFSDQQGRIYNNVTNLSSDLRQFVTFEGQALVFVDVSHSHPVLISSFYHTDEEEEKAKYKEIVRNGELYSFINSRLESPFDLTDSEQRRQLKETVFGKIFYGSNYGPETESLSIFKKEFPNLALHIHAAKRRCNRDLPVELMRRESRLVIDLAACEFAKSHIDDVCSPCLLSLHDCLATTEEYAEEVKRCLERAFESEIGFAPRVNIK